ncbi:hypothetical protein AGRA3207_007887 (plasmid) [Actinomadura graeca]|uniref:Uncharacterized protein n=1 Tax=Actinomadura graeca TaxID=2750812 RepID=A0ABX8R8B5_9ACTN|nr:hypothetical protein [Actinomadura graeca]QXJ27088.1 hypothetical protein AGRA3207_007887 [Actinomadura graeca]
MVLRNLEVGGMGGGESQDRVCAHCGTPIQQRPRGRPIRYCGARCRVAASRAAHRTPPAGLAEAPPDADADAADGWRGRAAEVAERRLVVLARNLATAASSGQPDPLSEAAAHRLVDRLAALARTPR